VGSPGARLLLMFLAVGFFSVAVIGGHYQHPDGKPGPGAVSSCRRRSRSRQSLKCDERAKDLEVGSRTSNTRIRRSRTWCSSQAGRSGARGDAREKQHGS
jgi:hypothetical protein